MSTINYSKWDHIEVSDDEDDTHPNIDTPSLFRWRHQARVDRMTEAEKEKEEFQKEYQGHQQKMAAIKQKLKESEKESALDQMDSVKAELKNLEKQEQEFKKKEDDLKKKERMTPLNIDTICKDGKSKTIINKFSNNDTKELSEEEKVERQAEFNKKHKEKVKKFGMFSKYEDSQEYLSENLELVCEETANNLVLWCLDLELEEKHDLMDHVAHQTIVMQFILELAKQLETDPRQCVRPFFSRIKMAQKEYRDAFNDELNGFKDRIRMRAKVKIQEAMKEYEEEEKQKRLGPGGLDPVEVFESLPESMKDCFDKKDIGLLQKVVLELPKKEAEYHMKRCVESGLWVPNAADADGDDDDDDTTTSGVQEQGDRPQQEEEVYDEVS